MSKKPKAKPSASSAVNFELVEEILDLMTKRGLARFEWQKGDFKVSLDTQAQVAVAQSMAPAPVHAPAQVSEEKKSAPANANTKTITSPFVGTFYRSPSPTAPEYVKVGQKIKKGDVLCIVEAMKLMNEIESDVNGTVLEVLLENGQPVEFGAALFRVDLS